MWFWGLDILVLISIYPTNEANLVLTGCHSGIGQCHNAKWEGHCWDTCDIRLSLIADFPKFDQFYSGFEIRLKLAGVTS